MVFYVCHFSTNVTSLSIVDEGHLYVWGSNKHGQLVSKEIFLTEPKKIETEFFSHEKVGAVWSGWTHLVAQTGRMSKKPVTYGTKTVNCLYCMQTVFFLIDTGWMQSLAVSPEQQLSPENDEDRHPFASVP